MNWLLIANNVTSALVVLTCWWLAHSNARARPPGRAIATGYGLIGISVLFTGVLRNLDVVSIYAVPWLVVGTKAMLAATFMLTIYRRSHLGDR